MYWMVKVYRIQRILQLSPRCVVTLLPEHKTSSPGRQHAYNGFWELHMLQEQRASKLVFSWIFKSPPRWECLHLRWQELQGDSWDFDRFTLQLKELQFFEKPETIYPTAHRRISQDFENSATRLGEPQIWQQYLPIYYLVLLPLTMKWDGTRSARRKISVIVYIALSIAIFRPFL
jgi:hypothetical protein